MKSSTGRWVSGDDFFDRERELRLLESRVRDGNHVLLTGQRRMGKTSIARELGRRLESEGWTSLFTDVEDAVGPEDVIADIAQAVHPIRSISSRFAATMGRWLDENVEEISASDFRVKIRAGMSGSWKRHGADLISFCAEHRQPVLLVIDELPIFLMRLLRDDEGVRRVDDFLSWLRGTLQRIEGRSPVLVVSGSIGLAPLVQRLGIPDRINYLHPYRLGPWDRTASVNCFRLLTSSHGLRTDDRVADAVYEALGIGIPHHVQSYFAHLHDSAVMRNLDSRDGGGRRRGLSNRASRTGRAERPRALRDPTRRRPGGERPTESPWRFSPKLPPRTCSPATHDAASNAGTRR